MSKRWLTVIAAAGLLITGCASDGGGGSSSGSPTGPRTFTDPVSGFSLTYEPPFEVGTGPDVQVQYGQNNPPATSVMFYNPEVLSTPGSSASTRGSGSPSARQSPTAPARESSSASPSASAEKSGSAEPSPAAPAAVETLTVSVFPLATHVTAANLAEAEAQLKRDVLPQLDTSTPEVKFTTGPLSTTTLAGRPAFVADLTITAGTDELVGKYYFVFAEDHEFQVQTTAPKAEWSKAQPAFDQMLATLTLPGTWDSASASPSPSGS